MTLRTPRGYAVDRPFFKELCEGQRPNMQLIPLKAHTGLPAVRVDQYHHDPVVIDAGTLIGLYTSGTVTTSGSASDADMVLPAFCNTGDAQLRMLPHSDSATWAMTTASGNLAVAGGFVKPLGLVYKPIYSFTLESAFTNYKREHTVPYLTDYVIQIPAVTALEHLISGGDMVMVATGNYTGTFSGATTPTDLTASSSSLFAGRFMKFDSTAVNAQERIVGRCLKTIVLGDTGATNGTRLIDDAGFVASAIATNEFKGLSKVQTVPGLQLSGSGTGGIPGHLAGARCDSAGKYRALTILVRL